MSSSRPPFDLTAVAQDAPILLDLLERNPNLAVFTPSCSGYQAMRSIYNLNVNSVPLAIIRPLVVSEITTIVRYSTKNAIPLSVRVGGHDMFGRCMPHQGLVIDLRDINHCKVLDDESAAIIGGGIIQSDLIEQLAKTGRTTPFASAPSVGYVGWATLGGYGLLSGAFGLGVDQILEATIVTENGEVVQANSEMMYALRGGGGNLGIITELKIKTYPLRTLLGGLVAFESTNIGQKVRDFGLAFRELQKEGIPSAFGAQIAVANLPELGRCLISTFVWASPDHKAGRVYLERFKSLATPVMVVESEMSPPQWMEMVKNFGTYGVYNGIKSLNIQELSDDYLDIFAKHSENMPSANATLVFMHQLHGKATEQHDESCFPTRQPHFVLEILGSTKEEELKEASMKWSDCFYRELKDSDVAMEGGYAALVHPADSSPESCYGGNWAKLQGLKQKYDPNHVFQGAVPKISPSI